MKETKRNEALDLRSFFLKPHMPPREDIQGNKAPSLLRELFCQKYLLFSIMWLFVLHRGQRRGGEGGERLWFTYNPFVVT